MQWNTQQLKQCEQTTGQALLRNEQELVSVNQDFGHLTQGFAEAVGKPNHLRDLQNLLS